MFAYFIVDEKGKAAELLDKLVTLWQERIVHQIKCKTMTVVWHRHTVIDNCFRQGRAKRQGTTAIRKSERIVFNCAPSFFIVLTHRNIYPQDVYV